MNLIKKILRTILLFICLAILAYSSYNIYIKVKDYKEAEKVYSEIKEIKNTKETKNDMDEKLLAINNDYKLWIKIDNTNVDYPVVQGKDNDFYLKKDFNKQKSSTGTIFIDYENDINADENVIIYGHNMKNKTMFSQIEKFKDESFFKEKNKIKILLDNKAYTYEVFSVYYTKPDYDYLINSFENEEEYKTYLNNIQNKSIFESDCEVGASDKIITLSTCSYETKNNRTVVHGKLIP